VTIGTAVNCTVCGLRKKPRGRSAPLEMANSLCDHECPGYGLDPQVGQLWPDETSADFGWPIRAYGSDIEAVERQERRWEGEDYERRIR